MFPHSSTFLSLYLILITSTLKNKVTHTLHLRFSDFIFNLFEIIIIVVVVVGVEGISSSRSSIRIIDALLSTPLYSLHLIFSCSRSRRILGS